MVTYIVLWHHFGLILQKVSSSFVTNMLSICIFIGLVRFEDKDFWIYGGDFIVFFFLSLLFRLLFVVIFAITFISCCYFCYYCFYHCYCFYDWRYYLYFYLFLFLFLLSSHFCLYCYFFLH